MRFTENYGLNLIEGSDVVNPLVQDVANYEKIDEVMKDNENAGVSKATELLTGTVHVLTRDKQGSPMFRFVATSKFTTGDTFTVDGMQVTALTTTGEPLATGAYVIGSNVLCCLTGTLLTLFVGVGGEYKAYDSDRLGGLNANQYATSAQVADARNVAQAANDIALANKEEIGSDKGKILFLGDITLHYNNASRLERYFTELPASVFETDKPTYVFVNPLIKDGTAHGQTWAITHLLRKSTQDLLLRANGSFTSGQTLDCQVMIVEGK